jgi:hypothetical protein
VLLVASLLLSSQNFQEQMTVKRRGKAICLKLKIFGRICGLCFGSSASFTSKFSRTTHRILEGRLLQSGVKLLVYRWLSFSFFDTKIFKDQ